MLNNLLALWVARHGEDYNAVDHAKQALARNQRLLPTLPVTASLRAWTAGLRRDTPLLSDEDVSREAIYEDRG